MDLNPVLYGKLKMYADENGLPVKAAVRFILNQFLKDKYPFI